MKRVVPLPLAEICFELTGQRWGKLRNSLIYLSSGSSTTQFTVSSIKLCTNGKGLGPRTSRLCRDQRFIVRESLNYGYVFVWMKCDSAIIVHRTPGHKSKHGAFQSTRLTNKERQDNDKDQSNNGYRHRPHGRIQTVLLAGLFASAGGDWKRRRHKRRSWGKGNKKTKHVKIFTKNFVAWNPGTEN